ncbi:MAG: glutamate--cysteine ligase [Leptolyngbya sp. PLA1]|nr:glutamate--cysteine ligase [Leptolyngbya sp. PLA1]
MPFHLFERFGIEIEFAVVDRASLRVAPVVDRILQLAASLPNARVESESVPGWPDEIALGPITLGNELTAHVLELKVSEPAPSLDGLSDHFAAALASLRPALDRLGVMLLPSGMHPTMDPDREMVLWPHANSEVYRAFDRIFGCKGHGWANLQSCHLNLPFANDDEFGRLHAAIRALLPIMPALSASTPFMDGKSTGLLDNRLEVYRLNSRRVPQAAGLVIPERVYTHADYQRVILGEVYAGYAPHDPDGLLRDEWANARGAIARFGRGTIEIRVLDSQECPRADLAIASSVASVTRAIAEGRLGNPPALRAWAVEPLHAILLDVIRDADQATLSLTPFLRDLGYSGPCPAPAGAVWAELLDRALAGSRPAWRTDAERILASGCLARRISRATPSPADIPHTYRALAGCLEHNQFFGT